MHNKDVRILVVDDDKDILEILSYNLRREDFVVFKAKNGKSAIETARKEKPHIIILDIMMPKMDGVEVCRKLREDPRFQKTIIAFLTARGEDFTQIAALESGGDDFITKPIKPRVLISRIRALTRRLEHSTETVLQELGSLIINSDEFTVKVKGKKIDLPKKEFELLSLLASKPGKVFKRDEIYNKIWGMDVIVGHRTIDVHIRKLREKIGNRYIKTVKGIGYKLEF